jgi:hypothetical protein
MLDHIMVCNSKLGSYVPSPPDEDPDGCVFSAQRLQNGCCLLSERSSAVFNAVNACPFSSVFDDILAIPV